MSDSATKRRFSLKQAFANYGYVFILAFMVIVSTILSPVFLTTTNILNVLRQMSITVIIAYGVTMVIISGMI